LIHRYPKHSINANWIFRRALPDKLGEFNGKLYEIVDKLKYVTDGLVNKSSCRFVNLFIFAGDTEAS